MKTETLPEPWKDASSYSRGDTARTPVTWGAKFGKLYILVTRYVGYPKDSWLVLCHQLNIKQELKSKKLSEAACQAKAIVQVHLEELISGIITPNQ